MPYRGFFSREEWNRYTLNWQEQRKRKGLCTRCGAKREGKYARWCDSCGEKHRLENRKNNILTRLYREAMGLCIYCGKERDTPRSKECCLACLTKRLALPSQQQGHERRQRDNERKRIMRGMQCLAPRYQGRRCTLPKGHKGWHKNGPRLWRVVKGKVSPKLPGPPSTSSP